MHLRKLKGKDETYSRVKRCWSSCVYRKHTLARYYPPGTVGALAVGTLSLRDGCLSGSPRLLRNYLLYAEHVPPCAWDLWTGTHKSLPRLGASRRRRIFHLSLVCTYRACGTGRRGLLFRPVIEVFFEFSIDRLSHVTDSHCLIEAAHLSAG